MVCTYIQLFTPFCVHTHTYAYIHTMHTYAYTLHHIYKVVYMFKYFE